MIMLLGLMMVIREQDVPIEVGQVYQVERACLAPVNALWVDDCYKSMRADDKEGMRQLVRERKVLGIPIGCRLRILEVHPANRFRSYGYSEVQLIKDGEAVRRVYLFHAYVENGNVVIEGDDDDPRP